MEALLLENALTQTYKDVEGLINKKVWQFYYRYGGIIEDWKSEAHLIFMKSYYSYEESKASFNTWLYIQLDGGLKDFYRKFISKNQPSTVDKDGNDFMMSLPENINPFYMPLYLLDEVKDDAKTILNLIWDMPEDLRNEKVVVKNSRCKNTRKHSCHIKKALKNYLLKLGWTHKRIIETFKEIGEVINA